MKKIMNFSLMICFISVFAIDLNASCNWLTLPCPSGPGIDMYCVNAGGSPWLGCPCGSDDGLSTCPEF